MDERDGANAGKVVSRSSDAGLLKGHSVPAQDFRSPTNAMSPEQEKDQPSQTEKRHAHQTTRIDLTAILGGAKTEVRSDNRSSYDALSLRVQGNVSHRANFVAHYTLSSAKTWGCLLGELFDYVNGVCDPTNAFAPGDYGPSGEDVRHRFVIAGTFQAPAKIQLSTLAQSESARPFTLTTPVGDRAVINGVKTTLDELRGAPYIQVDLRVSRPITFHERWTLVPFAEFFNLFNRNNPGAFYVTDISALPLSVDNPANATAFCLNASCTQTQPITSLNQLRYPAGAFGDFFGPGTTVGIPFAAQLGVKLTF